MTDEDEDRALVEKAERVTAEMLKIVRQVEKRLGLPRAFLLHLSLEDEWTCVIKTLAILESAIEEVIIDKCFVEPGLYGVGDPNALARVVGGMNLSGRVSKLALVRAYGLLTRSHLEFVETLAEVRNRYAHHPRNFDKPIRVLLGDDSEGRAKLAKLLMQQGMTASSEAEFDAALKSGITLTACGILWFLHFQNPAPPSITPQDVSTVS